MRLALAALREAQVRPQPGFGRGRRSGLAGICAMALLVSGCAARWVDEAGRVHVVGLVAMTVKPHPSAGEGASQVSFESIGASVTRTPYASAVSIGYSKDELTFVGIPDEPAQGGETNHEVPSPP